MGPHDAQAVPWEKSWDCPTRLKFGHFPFGIVFLLVRFLHVLFIFIVFIALLQPPPGSGEEDRSAQPLPGKGGPTAPGPSPGFGQVLPTTGAVPLLKCERFHLQPEDEPQFRAGTKTCSLIQGSQVLSCSFLLKGDT